jgi:hypothetical protein
MQNPLGAKHVIRLDKVRLDMLTTKGTLEKVERNETARRYQLTYPSDRHPFSITASQASPGYSGPTRGRQLQDRRGGVQKTKQLLYVGVSVFVSGQIPLT